MEAEVITVGDELLIGQVVNTNAAWMGEQLSLAGVDVARTLTLGDDVRAIQAALADAYRTSELVAVTGGLGPTHDDVTREAVAGFFEKSLRLNGAVLAHIEARFARRGRAMPESNRRQAMVPEGFEVLPNPVGTAPGLWHAGEAGGRPRLLAVLPGVPHEMRALMENEVLPRLLQHKNLRAIRHRTLLTSGIGESDLQDRLGDLSGWLGDQMRLAYLPGGGSVRLRLSAFGGDADEVEAALGRFEAHLRDRIGPHLFGTGATTLEAAVGELLKARGLTVAVAESCTGGFVLNRLTNVPGSSAYVAGGVVAYGNGVKVDALGVSGAALDEEGAVSEAVARQMARGIRDRLGADVGVSTTGVAGPSGGTPEKPVGTVWIGYADAAGDEARRLSLTGDRLLNKELTSTAVLNEIRHRLGESLRSVAG